MVQSLVLRSFRPKCIMTKRTRGETGVLCPSICKALDTLAPGKQSTCISGSWISGSRLMFEAPMIRMGLDGVRDQVRVLLPQCSCLEKRLTVVGCRWVGIRGSNLRGRPVVWSVRLVGAGPRSGVILLASGMLSRGRL